MSSTPLLSGPRVEFDCLPLRSISRFDIPLDASPKYQAWCERLKAAVAKHGTYNTYYLHRARCQFWFTNQPGLGEVEFEFEGTVFTDPTDTKTLGSDLTVKLHKETCDWLTKPVVAWLEETVRRAVCADFDRYIAAGDLQRTQARMDQLQAQADAAGAFVGMYL